MTSATVIGYISTVLLALAYIAGAIASLVLARRNAGRGAWLALAAFALLACEILSRAVIFSPVFVRLFSNRLAELGAVTTCWGTVLGLAAAILLILAIVTLARRPASS